MSGPSAIHTYCRGVRELHVDGETFEVSTQPGSWNAYELKWVSGPNEGYGFVCSAYGSQPISDSDLEDAIRRFLAQINPATGYLG